MSEFGESKEPGKVIPFSRGEEIESERQARVDQLIDKLEKLEGIELELRKKIEAEPVKGAPSEELIALMAELEALRDIIYSGHELLSTKDIDQRKFEQFMEIKWKENKS